MRLFLPGPSLARAGWRSQTATIQSLIKKRNISDDALKQRVQIYRSMCDDPYVNLSIEHHLMKRSDEESTVLFLYVNRPSIVIGRNQNPWKEINFVEQRRGVGVVGAQNKAQPIYLVRRRSGGGTVFHDRGNVNWCVICPPRHFDRDLHAKMVARALGKIGCEGVRVNERHDIVQDVQEEDGLKTYKVSGSAYKLTRTRSLHHGTCLLHSIDSSKISQLLKSPADGYIKAAGVDSVRSPVRNLMKERREFSDAVQNEFRLMYAGFQADFMLVHEHDAMAIEPLRKGVEELKSAQWFWGQTPQFTVSFKPTLEDSRERPRNELSKLISPDVARYLDIKITVRHGIIIGIMMRGLDWAEDIKEDMSNVLADTFVETPIYQLDFLPKLAKLCRNNPRSYKKLVQVTDWLHAVFGSRPSPLRAHFLHPSKVVEEDEKELTAAETETAKLKGDEVEFEAQQPRELDPWADRIAKLLKKPAEAQHKAP